MRYSAPSRVFALLIAVLLVLGAVPGVVAAEERAGGTIVVGPDETVQGDLQAFGGSVVVYGTVTGDVQAFAGDVVIAGTVNGNVEAAAGSVSVTGDVGGNVQAAGGSVSVGQGATIGGNLEAGAGSIYIAGTVEGDARVGADTITLAPSATIGGNLVYDGDLHQQPGAQVSGEVRRDSSMSVDVAPGIPGLPDVVGTVYGILVNLVVGAVLLALFPTFTGEVSRRVREEPVNSGLAGLVTLVLGTIAIIIFAITLIGIPLAIIVAIALGLTGWLGSILGQYAVGDFVLRRTGREDRWLALAVGIIGFAIIGLVPIVGGLAAAIAGLLGFGAVTGQLYDRYKSTDSTGENGGRQTTLDESA